MKVRRYEPSDLESVARVFTASVHALAADHYDTSQRAAWAPPSPDLEAWKSRMERQDALVAEDENGAIAGFIAYDRGGHVDLIFTAPEHARKGVATLLYQSAEADLAIRGVTALFTEASITARPFFESQGFRTVKQETVHREAVTLERYVMRKIRDGVG